MYVTIRALLTTSERHPRIAFVTPWGDGQGIWIGRTPRVGDCYAVELEVADALRWGETIVGSDRAACRLAVEDDTVIVDGLLEHVEPTGTTDVCTIRLETSLMMVETIGSVPSPGCYVRLSAPNLQLFDTNL